MISDEQLEWFNTYLSTALDEVLENAYNGTPYKVSIPLEDCELNIEVKV